MQSLIDLSKILSKLKTHKLVKIKKTFGEHRKFLCVSRYEMHAQNG